MIGDKTFVLGSFLILSVITNYLVYLFLSNTRLLYRFPLLRLDSKPRPMSVLYCYILLGLGLFIYFANNLDSFRWGAGSSSMGSPLYSLLFRLFIPMTVLIIGFSSISSRVRKLPFIGAGLLGALLIVVVSLKSSSRSDILYFLLSLVVLVVLTYKVNKVKLFAGLLIGAVLSLGIGQIMLFQRGSVDGDLLGLIGMVSERVFSLDEATVLLFVSQDYFSPAATLVMSIEKAIIIPAAAIKSNLFNFFYLVHEETISGIVVGQYGLSFMRGAGFSYVLYTEGYNIFGFMGFLYNGVAAGFLLHILNPNFKGVSAAHKNVLVAILTVLLLQLIRSQTGSALKSIYTFIPVYYSYCLLFGYSLRFKRPNRVGQIFAKN